VISVVEDAASARVLPVNYPEDKDSRWLNSLVEWWQHRRPEAVRAFAGSRFNHGERLYGAENAIKRATLALPLWWPVNMAELAHIQNMAIGFAVDNPTLDKPVVAGRLIAMAAIGMHDTVLPEMAGTALDRAVDLRPDWPHRLAYLAAQPRADTQAEWTEALADVGKATKNDVLVPSIGLDELQAALAMHRDLGDAPARFRRVVRAVDDLARHSAAARDALSRGPSPETRAYWAAELTREATSVLRAVKAVASGAGVPGHDARAVRPVWEPTPMISVGSSILVDAALAIAVMSGDVANHCDHVEHNEAADLDAIRRAGRDLRTTAVALSLEAAQDPVALYVRRLAAIEQRNVLWHDGAFDGAALARSASTWRALQIVQAAHDKAYHSDVVGLAKADQLRHYALHVAKLAGSTAVVARGDGDLADWLHRRVPDMLLFGIKLATVSGEKLPEEDVPRRRPATPIPREAVAELASM